MTNKGMFEDAIKLEKKDRKIKKLNIRIKDLMAINQEHQSINGKLRAELEIEKKNHTLSREALELEVRVKDKELGRLMKKLQNKSL
jgi:predicted RNase H-like nuclease (RuvC/YqgF family)